MKLEINTAGAWKTVCEFDAGRLREVLDAVEILAAVVPDANWSVRDDNGVRRWLHIRDGISEEKITNPPVTNPPRGES